MAMAKTGKSNAASKVTERGSVQRLLEGGDTGPVKLFGDTLSGKEGYFLIADGGCTGIVLIDLAKPCTDAMLSKTGESHVLATVGAPAEMFPGVKVGITAYKPIPADKLPKAVLEARKARRAALRG